MRKTSFGTFAVLFAAVALMGCSTSPRSTEQRANLRDEGMTSVKEMERTDVGLEDFLNKAYGYTIFPSVGKGGAIVGGAYGKGVVYEKGQWIGYADLSQATVGLQLGGQTYSELIAFETREALDRFKNNQLAFSANASAVALKSGASTAAKYTDGVAVFTAAKGGLMFEASIGGQKFTFVPRENAGPAKEGQ